MSEKKLFLLDAMALIYRAYFSLARSPRITSTGRNTNAQFGFTNTLVDLLNKEKPSHLAVVFEGGKTDQDTHRTAQFAEYKANRQSQPEDISSALPDIERIIKGFSLPCLSSPGYEADDVIGTLALEAADLGYTVYMVTPDKDYGQIVRDNIFIYKPGYQGSGHEILGREEVCAKWGIKRIDQVIDMLGLMGDAVDNIPGIKGIGEKTAAKLLEQYDTVEGVLAAADTIKGAVGDKIRAGRESAVLSKMLATIITDVPIKFHEEDFRVKEWNKDALRDIFTDLEFKAMGRRVLGEDTPAAPQQTDLFGNPARVRTVQPGSTPHGDGSAQTEPAEEAHPQELRTIRDTPHDYRLYSSIEEVDGLIGALMAQTRISFDTETTSKDANLADLVGLSFAWTPGEGHYVALPEDREGIEKVLSRFTPLFSRTDVQWIGQNIKYDLLVLKWYGVELASPVWDTMLAHYLLDPEGKRSMDDLAVKYLGYQPVPIEDLIGKKGKGQLTMRDVDVQTVKEYAGEDADITLQLRNTFDPMLDTEGGRTLFDTVENPLVPVLVDMEHEGVGVDVGFLQAYSADLERDIRVAEEAVYEKAGARFNLGSPRQLGEVLFDVLKIDGGGRKTRTGQYATGEDILAKLRSKHPIVEDILTYRQLTKLKSTYVDALPQLIHPKTGRVHTSFNQTVAVTGRLSSNNPNLQNIPIRTDAGKEIRKAFISRGEGWTLVSADYSQIELRIIAALAGESAMIEAFAGDKDIHTATAASVFAIPESEVSKEQRRRAKAVNFGIIYGQSAFGLADKLGIARGEARDIIDAYFKTYPGIKGYIERQIQLAREQQYVSTVMGRRRWLRDIVSGNQTVRSFAERNAVNMPIQGTAAEMIKMAMIRVHRELKARNMETKMILQVHDELVFDVPESELGMAQEMIRAEMEAAMVLPGGVPVVAETGAGRNWLEAH